MVIEAQDALVEQNVDVGRKQDAVLRIETLGGAGISAWLDVRGAEEVAYLETRDSAGVAPAFVDVPPELPLPASCVYQRLAGRFVNVEIPLKSSDIVDLGTRRNDAAFGEAIWRQAMAYSRWKLPSGRPLYHLREDFFRGGDK